MKRFSINQLKNINNSIKNCGEYKQIFHSKEITVFFILQYDQSIKSVLR